MGREGGFARCVASMKSRFSGCFLEGHILGSREQGMKVGFLSSNRYMITDRSSSLKLLVKATCIYIHTYGHTTIYIPQAIKPPPSISMFLSRLGPKAPSARHPPALRPPPGHLHITPYPPAISSTAIPPEPWYPRPKQRGRETHVAQCIIDFLQRSHWQR